MKQGEFEGQLIYAYWFHASHKLGNKKLWEITDKIGMPKQVFEADPKRYEEVLAKNQAKLLADSRRGWDLEGKWEELQKEQIRFLPFFHEDYPEYLRNIPDAPWAVYLKGRMPKGTEKRAAVVGARQCSEYGRAMAKQLGRMLGENNIPVISGMARGIDGISQKAAMEAGGGSLAVLGCGVDICYPKENRALYEQLLGEGGILSEYPPGTAPIARNFPPRNRIISGLCDVLIVVEAKEKSGTLITVDMALEQGKEVFALPGRVTDALSMGCNQLIRQGAGILLSPEDIFGALGTKRKQRGKKQGHEDELKTVCFRTGEERALYGILDYMPKNIEQIWQEYGTDNISMQQLMKALLELCLKGAAAQAGGSYYRL